MSTITIEAMATVPANDDGCVEESCRGETGCKFCKVDTCTLFNAELDINSTMKCTECLEANIAPEGGTIREQLQEACERLVYSEGCPPGLFACKDKPPVSSCHECWKQWLEDETGDNS